MNESATVEVLTAEVRVLMVGHRQVTLSVFRQLDTVNPAIIKPFGRVRDTKNVLKPGISFIEVVGADGLGNLVKSFMQAPQKTIYLNVKEDGRITEGGTYINTRQSNFRYQNINFPIVMSGKDLSEESEENKANIIAISSVEAEEYLSHLKIYQGFKALPLIVLAGLK